MTTESGTDLEAKQPQENKETEKGKSKAAEPASPQNQPEQLPAAAGHSTPARKEQVRLWIQFKSFTLFNMYQYFITLVQNTLVIGVRVFLWCKHCTYPFMSGLNLREHYTPFMLNELCLCVKNGNDKKKKNTDDLSVLNGGCIPVNLSFTQCSHAFILEMWWNIDWKKNPDRMMFSFSILRQQIVLIKVTPHSCLKSE